MSIILIFVFAIVLTLWIIYDLFRQSGKGGEA